MHTMPDKKRVSFKYRSGSAALRSLSDGTAYFASPGELNDSLEAKFVLPERTTYAEKLSATFSELAEERKAAYRFEPDPNSAEEVELHVARESEAFLKQCGRVGIYSGTTRPDNQPMWAYYCGDSKGVCFEFEWPDDVLKEYSLLPTFVEYSNKPRIHDRYDDMREEVRALARERPDWSVEDLFDHAMGSDFTMRWMVRSMGRAVSTKHADWAHENELRMVSPKAGALPILKRLLKRVYFTRTDFSEWGPIIMLLHQLYPKVELAEVRFSHVEPVVSIVPMTKRLVPVNPASDSGAGA
jgi:Protein of unknown function (DUF2971)